MLRFLIYTILVFTAGYLWGRLSNSHAARPYPPVTSARLTLAAGTASTTPDYLDNYALLTDGQILRYDLCAEEEVVPGFTYLGRGVIHSSGGVLQNFSDTLNFFER